jgi:Na+/H+-dicarboxylate symporter
MAPAQLLALTSSSSAATLPVTMECAIERLGVSRRITSFVCPLGATINMDGTALYQGIATVFIAQMFGADLTVADQLAIVLLATLASIGSPGIPSGGIVMLLVILQSLGLNPAGIALVLAVDRPLDMLRTVVNVSGDAMVSAIIARGEGESIEPPRNPNSGS